MRAIEIREGRLVPCERPLPQLRDGEVLIKVHAAGVNRADVLQRKGFYPPPAGASDIPGLEVSGVIEEGAGEWRSGDSVCALTTGGGYAEYCVAPAGSCLPVPHRLTPVEAASFPETCFTVWGSVFELANLREGETLLVTGGSSGIGVTAIQIASALGHRVFALAGSREKCAACEKLGAAHAYNYREDDFVAALKGATGERGVDVVLDMAGGDFLAREAVALALDGRIAIVGFMGGAKATLDLSQFLFKRASLRAFTLRSRSNDYKAGIARALRDKVWPLIEQQKINPVVHATFRLEEAARAHEMLEAGAHIGKIVLTLN